MHAVATKGWHRDNLTQEMAEARQAVFGPGEGILAPMQEAAAEETAEVLALLTPEQQEELKAMPLAQQAEVLALQRQFQGRIAPKLKAKA